MDDDDALAGVLAEAEPHCVGDPEVDWPAVEALQALIDAAGDDEWAHLAILDGLYGDDLELR